LAFGYESLLDGEQQHLALVKGDVAGKDGVLVRVQLRMPHWGCFSLHAL
jgi:GTP cyclohydrolase II